MQNQDIGRIERFSSKTKENKGQARETLTETFTMGSDPIVKVEQKAEGRVNG